MAIGGDKDLYIPVIKRPSATASAYLAVQSAQSEQRASHQYAETTSQPVVVPLTSNYPGITSGPSPKRAWKSYIINSAKPTNCIPSSTTGTTSSTTPYVKTSTVTFPTSARDVSSAFAIKQTGLIPGLASPTGNGPPVPITGNLTVSPSRPQCPPLSVSSSTPSNRVPSSTHNSRRPSTSTTFTNTTTVSSIIPSPKLEQHNFESCPHTSPPHNRPLNAQPHLTPNPAYNSVSATSYHLPQFTSMLPGACHTCDIQRRRDTESAIIAAYGAAIWPKKNHLDDFRRKQASGADARVLIEDLEREIRALEGQGERELRGIWSGYSARWGPGTIGLDGGLGRMRVEWIRPEKKE